MIRRWLIAAGCIALSTSIALLAGDPAKRSRGFVAAFQHWTGAGA